MKTIKIAHTLSAALTLHATAEIAARIDGMAPTASAQSVPAFDTPSCVSGTPDTIETQSPILLSHPDTAFSVLVDPTQKWDANAVQRYRKLAVKEALSSLVKTEKTEMSRLEELRLRKENTLSPSELIEQYRREKTGIEMLRVIQKYVRVIPQR